jgi:hypothetical protein
LTATRNPARDARGLSRLAVDATLGLTDLVEALHGRIARTPVRLTGAAGAAVERVTGQVYRSIRGATRAIGGGIDALLARLVPLVRELPDTPQRDALVAALNGVLGDHLAASGNPLAIPMELVHDGKAVDLAPGALAKRVRRPSTTLVVAVHGLCLSDRHWERDGHDHRPALAGALGADVLSLRYNTGLHVSVNGRALAGQLEALVEAWPVDVARVVVVGHSMGGLVARSAAEYGARAQHRWRAALDTLVFLGTPHHGSPLERAGHGVDVLLASLPYAAPLARLGQVRSAGITDMRYGSVLDDDWVGGDRFARTRARRHPLPLPASVDCHAIAGSLDAVRADRRRMRGDGIVPLASALGTHRDPRFDLAVPATRQWIAAETGHLALLASRAVTARMLEVLSRGASASASSRDPGDRDRPRSGRSPGTSPPAPRRARAR